MYECMKELPSCSILKRGRVETERRVPFDAVRLGNSFVTLLSLSLSPSPVFRATKSASTELNARLSLSLRLSACQSDSDGLSICLVTNSIHSVFISLSISAMSQLAHSKYCRPP